MEIWVRASIVGSLCLAVGCRGSSQDSHAEADAGPRAAPSFVQGGSIPYVLGVLPDGQPITAGGRQLLVPASPGREPLDFANEPRRLHPDLTGAALRLDPSLKSGQAGPRVFASSWWPQSDNGIALRWSSSNKDYEDLTSDPDNLAPSEKYDLLFFPGQRRSLPEVESFRLAELRSPESERGLPTVHPAITVAGPTTQWELQNHGVYQRVTPESWWGHCNGWAAYTVAEPGGAPARDVRVKLSGGGVVECGSGELGCVLFRMADIEALMTELYFNAAATAAGRRCNTEPDKIERDSYGRPTDAACRDLNPATMHIALTRLLGVGARPLSPGSSAAAERLPFVIDHQLDWEVWSFPVTGFAIDRIEEMDGAQAMRLLCEGRGQPSGCGLYQFNENATRFARVETRYSFVSVGASTADLKKPAAQRRLPLAEERLRYVLEMRGDGTIVGGEWLAPPSVVAGPDSQKVHPDFLFLPVRPQAAGEDGDDRGGDGDNPYLSYSNVKALLSLSTSRPGG